MNEEARAELDRVLALEPAALTDSDQAFLHARRSYLTEERRINFGLTEEVPATKESSEVEAPRTRRGRTPAVSSNE